MRWDWKVRVVSEMWRFDPRSSSQVNYHIYSSLRTLLICFLVIFCYQVDAKVIWESNHLVKDDEMADIQIVIMGHFRHSSIHPNSYSTRTQGWMNLSLNIFSCKHEKLSMDKCLLQTRKGVVVAQWIKESRYPRLFTALCQVCKQHKVIQWCPK